MRPDDRGPGFDEPVDGGLDLPFDADLEALHAELDAAGTQARGALHGRTQPTRVFGNDLRARLVGSFAAPAAPALGPDVALPRPHPRGDRLRPELVTPGETWAPTPLEPRIVRRTPTVMPRARWALAAAATLVVVVVAGALGARFDWLIPAPTADASAPPASALPATPKPTPATTAAPILSIESPGATPVPTPEPTSEPDPTATPRPEPTKPPRPTATPKPEPTKPPIGPLDLAAEACPGGVVLDWTKPSTAVNHYHLLRSLVGDFPPTYPAGGTTEIDSATSWSAGTTDGFDATIGGGKTATYRAFAFDDADEVLAASSSRTVSTIDRIDIGPLGVVEDGPGSITVSWSAASVSAGCFTYGKLVASETDPDPSYLEGSPYLAAIGDPAATSVALEGLEPGAEVWMRYEIIRVTSLGKFVVASSDVRQVTYPGP
jgi:hypothetical protein